jgi:type 1 glutamine amidotransferase
MKLAALLLVTVLTTSLATAPSSNSESVQTKRKVVFIAGPKSHGYGAHEHNAGALLLSRLLAAGHPAIETVVHQNGWPADPHALDDAAAIVIFANGGMGNPAREQLPALAKAMERGAGLVLLHYAVEIPADSGGPEFLDWAGGYFAINWSVNPVWTMQSNPFPEHPITRGLRPYVIEDEWYYHMRFRAGMRGVQPILSALPPASSLSRPDGLHSGNLAVRAAVLERKEPQVLAWAAERANGGRGFGFTGGHFHWNWGHPMQRRLVLNAIAWAAQAEVPRAGMPVGTLTMEELEANQDDPRPASFERARWVQLIEQWQREFPAGH